MNAFLRKLLSKKKFPFSQQIYSFSFTITFEDVKNYIKIHRPMLPLDKGMLTSIWLFTLPSQ